MRLLRDKECHFASPGGKIQEMEDGLGVPLTQRITGGPHGGGTRLTAAGQAYIAQFHAAMAGLKELAERQFRAVFGED